MNAFARLVAARVRPAGLLSARLLTLLVLPALASCSSVEYYWQGIRGQVDLLQRAKPIPEVVATESDAKLREKLTRVMSIREFASRELGLPDNNSYRRYTKLERRFVLWNVFATPELSLKPLEWCFPIAGCVNYRGYFEEAAARIEAGKIAATGEDTYIGGVPAYSTLGYFDDPVLSTFIRYPDPEMARLIFHELAHQVAYAKDDTVFNESFAVEVEDEGVGRWLASQGDAALNTQYETSQRYREAFRTLVRDAREKLASLYASSASVEDKRKGKAEAFAAMRANYDALKLRWGGYGPYDMWFSQGPNNANLAAVGLYSQDVPVFRALLAEEHGDLPRFYARVKELAAMPKAERERVLAGYRASTSAAAGRGGER